MRPPLFSAAPAGYLGPERPWVGSVAVTVAAAVCRCLPHLAAGEPLASPHLT